MTARTETPRPGQARRRRASRVFLVAAAAGAVALLAPRVPKDQPLRLVFAPRPATPVRVTITWRDIAGDAAGGATRWLPAHTDTLEHTLRAPDGNYVLEIGLEGQASRELKGHHQHRVELHGDTTTLYLNDRK